MTHQGAASLNPSPEIKLNKPRKNAIIAGMIKSIPSTFRIVEITFLDLEGGVIFSTGGVSGMFLGPEIYVL
jgi:hypothetical protein